MLNGGLKLAIVGLAGLLAIAAFSPPPVQAQEKVWRNALTLFGTPKYGPDFKHFDYVNVDAPKGGELRLSNEGTFDSFNPLIDKGAPADGMERIYETLLTPSMDEIITSYGLLAEAVSYPDDYSSVSFRLRPQAKWADGEPVTPEDVVFSFDSAKANSVRLANYYRHVKSAEKTGEREVTFTFDQKGNRELPEIVGELSILAKHWWQGKDANGNQRDISRSTLELPMGSGPYKVASMQPGSTIRYELRKDYWGAALPANIGAHNFGTVTYVYFNDPEAEFQAFKAGDIDFYQEKSSSRWATRYDFDAVKDGRIVREALPNRFRATGIMQALVPNMRRDMFKDARIREALNYAFDFEDMNKNLAYGGLKRVDSFFWGTELASSGLPQGKELEILNGLKDKVPADVFTKPYANPVNGEPLKVRDNLKTAIALFKAAGYELKGNRMLNAKTGQPFSFEIMLSSPSLVRSIQPFVNSLGKIGIAATLRTVDTSQYINRIRNFDYDMIWNVWGESMNPGNEQRGYWGSESANTPGSQNYAGITDPAVDQLIDMITSAKDREEQVAAVHAMDRVLLANHYVVPLFYSGEEKFAYWKKLTHAKDLPTYSSGFPSIWWSTEAVKK
ncbi:microcin C transport system substrate-binding protein [Rhizobium aquaticum]|uniref:Microcin C transport system substrate-binding protein n=1 Tax=Rhizobium aquaticum TaxID=1549636 RepID=A0ABV2J1U4_9HYPH